METHEKMRDYLRDTNLTMSAVADILGCSHSSLNYCLNTENNGWIESAMKAFLETDGPRLNEISQELKGLRAEIEKTRPTKRGPLEYRCIELHRERVRIFNKKRVQPTTNQRVPFQNN